MKRKKIKLIGKVALSCFLSLLMAFPASASEEREVVPGEIRDGVQTYTIDGQEGFMEITPEDIEEGVIGVPVASVEPEAAGEETEDDVPETDDEDDDLTVGGVIFMVLSAIFLFIFGIIITLITACFDKKSDKAEN